MINAPETYVKKYDKAKTFTITKMKALQAQLHAEYDAI